MAACAAATTTLCACADDVRARPAAPPFVGDVSTDDIPSRLGGTTPGASWGVSVACAGDVDGDGTGDVVLGAPQDPSGGAGAGAIAFAFGPIDATRSGPTAEVVLAGGAAHDNTGISVAAAGDVDGDGLGDVLVGAWQHDGVARDSGAAYLVRGSARGALHMDAQDIVLAGDGPDAYAGFAVAGAGDVDGDGLSDVLVSSFHARTRGAIGLLYGPVRRGAVLLDDADALLRGASEGDHAGIAIGAAGDVDGDGLGDVLVGAPFHDEGGIDAGAVHVVLGPLHGDVYLHDSTYAQLVGEAPDDQAGTSVARIGDVDGDGIEDLAVGAPFSDRGGLDAGAVYVVRGPVRGTMALADAYGVLVGENPGDGAGIAVAGVADRDGDGRAELLVGAWGSDVSAESAGAAYLVYGRDVAGVVPLSRAGARLLGGAAQDGVGGSVASCDLDGDSRGDLLVGAAGLDGASRDEGVVLVVTSRGQPR